VKAAAVVVDCKVVGGDGSDDNDGDGGGGGGGGVNVCVRSVMGF